MSAKTAAPTFYCFQDPDSGASCTLRADATGFCVSLDDDDDGGPAAQAAGLGTTDAFENVEAMNAALESVRDELGDELYEAARYLKVRFGCSDILQ